MTALLEHVSVFAALSVFIGYLVFGLTGFGSALVIIPLLSWQWPLSVIVPLVLLLDIAASLLHTGFNLRQVQWRLIPVLVPFAIVGAWAGAWLHRWSDSPVLLALLGAYLGWIALQNLRRQPLTRMPVSRPASAAAGTVMGLIETLLGTAGPVVMAWLTGQIRSAEGTRATAPVIILIMVCIALMGNGLAGHLQDDALIPRLLVLVPLALAGVWVGHQVHSKMPAAMALPIIHLTLLLSGLALLARALDRN